MGPVVRPVCGKSSGAVLGFCRAQVGEGQRNLVAVVSALRGFFDWLGCGFFAAGPAVGFLAGWGDAEIFEVGVGPAEAEGFAVGVGVLAFGFGELGAGGLDVLCCAGQGGDGFDFGGAFSVESFCCAGVKVGDVHARQCSNGGRRFPGDPPGFDEKGCVHRRRCKLSKRVCV